MSGLLRFGSVCSGIEAASVAWHPLGWKAAWLSEIEPFPCAVLKHHYPDVPNYGDMMLLPAKILAGEVEAPDLFCGGTPCQAFSVAGLRNSLDDARGNLSLTFCEIANAIDNRRSVRGESPSIVFWENVPGVLNTKDNAFGCFLGALAGEDEALIAPGGRWTNAGFIDGPQRAVAWRVLDAQYFGVAQRRRRVFVVASAREDFDPAEVLFEFEGVRRDTAPSREAREGAADGSERGTASGKSTFGTLMANVGTKLWLGNQEALSGDYHVLEPVVYENHPTDSRIKEMGDVCSTVTSRWGTGGNNVPLVGPMVAQPIIGGVDYENNAHGPDDVTGPLLKGSPTGGGRPLPAIALHNMAVRRLTPVECERLQGFPDGYTNILWRGKDESPDGPRYKALGNSWAVPVVRWIGERIARAT